MIQTFFSCVDDGELVRLRQWMGELRDRRDEVLETFANEGTRHEQVFLLRPDQGFVMVHVIEREDADAGRRAFLSSQLPIDVEHREVMDLVTVGPAEVELLLDLQTGADRTG